LGELDVRAAGLAGRETAAAAGRLPGAQRHPGLAGARPAAGGKEIVGTATAVDDQGRLCIDTGDSTEVVAAADIVHLRPVSTPRVSKVFGVGLSGQCAGRDEKRGVAPAPALEAADRTVLVLVLASASAAFGAAG
jgi:hypothetical protein